MLNKLEEAVVSCTKYTLLSFSFLVKRKRNKKKNKAFVRPHGNYSRFVVCTPTPHQLQADFVKQGFDYTSLLLFPNANSTRAKGLLSSLF